MATEFSIQKMVSDGTLSTITLGIQYLQRNDIYMRIAGEETPQSGAPSGYTWYFVDNTTLKILPVVPNGVEVVVYRRTDINAMYNIYSQNAQFDEATIDENNQQLLYIAQEYLEQGIPGAGVDTLEFVRDDGTYTYYRIKRTDGSYSDEFAVPSAGSATKIFAREALRRSYAEAGYNLVDGSFETGGTLVNANDVMLQEANGTAYNWDGVFPSGGKAVPPGSTPASTGGVGPSGWLDIGDASVRGQLSEAGGVSLVNGANYRFGTAAEMAAQTVFEPRNGDVCVTSGYYAQADGGGAAYTYSSASAAVVDGFLVHNCAAGGRWLLVDNRSRLPVQVAGARVDGVTDDLAPFLAILAAKRKTLLDGAMYVSGAAKDLAPYVSSQQLRFDMEGADPVGSQLLFDANGGLFSSTFFRGFSLKNINIKNKAMDKTGVGFSNDPGAEMVNWENVTFTGWRCGFNLHCWNSNTKNVASRSCYYPGAIYGTSQDDASFYAVQCDYAWAPGCKYPGGLSGVMGLPSSAYALSYANLKSFAADGCGPYILGRCFNSKISAPGAERSIGPYIFDLSIYPTNTGRQNIAIECLDSYVQSGDGVSAIFGPIANAYGSLSVENSRVFSDKSIPLFAGDGRGIKLRNVSYVNRLFTGSDTNGLVVNDELIVGSDYNQLQKGGCVQGGYNRVRKVRAFMAMAVSATSKVVMRIHNTSQANIGAGFFVSGKATFHPVHKGGNNAAREAGIAVFSVAGDSGGGFTSINLQKLGTLTNLTATNRVTGTVQELVLTLPAAAVQYFCELEFWCNGIQLAGSAIDYYVES